MGKVTLRSLPSRIALLIAILPVMIWWQYFSTRNPDRLQYETPIAATCIRYVEHQPFCECFARRQTRARAISSETLGRLSEKFTSNVNEALAQDEDDTITLEFMVYMTVHVGCMKTLL